VVLGYLVLLVGIFLPRLISRHLVRVVSQAFEPFGNVIVWAATAVVIAGLFSFWPAVNGSRAELSRIVAVVRLEEELKTANDRYYAALAQQDEIGRQLIKLLKREELSRQENEQADKLEELIDNIYKAIAQGEGEANSKLDAARASMVIEEMKRGLVQSAQRSAQAPPVCGDPYYLCPDDVSRLADADRSLAEERNRTAQQGGAAIKLKAEVELPLEAAVRVFLATRHGRELKEDAARFTAAIVMTIITGSNEEGLDRSLTNAGTRASERSGTAQAQVALMVCTDLYNALDTFLRTDRGKELLDHVRADPIGFGLKNATDTGTGLSISPDPILRRVNDYLVDQQSSGALRVTLFGLLPPTLSEGARTTASNDAAPIFSGILRAACYQRLSPQDLTGRLDRLSRAA
jgi:hypothetical protein